MRPKCKECGSKRVNYRGTRKGKWGITYKRFKCMDCGSWDRVQAKGQYARTPKVLLFDIETAPMQVDVWSLRQHGWISPDSIRKDWFIISWAAKWLYSGRCYSDVVSPKEAEARDDSRVVEGLWELLDAADVVISHNGNRFDIKKANTRFLLHGYPPPHSYRSVDTLQIAKKHFAFSSNKLDYINKQLGLPPKLETGYELWLKCEDGDKEALKRMVTYNREDVFIMEETYMSLRPWISNHPNLPLLANMDGTACPVCMSDDLSPEGLYYTHLYKYQEYRCQSCGAIGRGRRSLKPDEGQKLIRPNHNMSPTSIPKIS